MGACAYHPTMVTYTQLLAFTMAAVLITATPGPDNLMVLGMSMSKGRRQGIAFGLGCAVGCLSHTLLAVFGIGALVAASPVAFTALKWLGGGYLIWLGVNALRGAGQGTRVSGVESRPASARELFLKGMFANAINPKVVLFFLSFLPQFVEPEQGGVGLQLGVLGVVFAIQAAVLFAVLAYFAGSIGAWLTRRPHASVWLDRLAGAVFVGLGLRMVTSR
jgi:threonine/homoserine/homoserine lactone efflux protein